MTTIVHDGMIDLMIGGTVTGQTGIINFATDTIDASLLDATDSGTILASFVDYDEVDSATVVATEADIMSGGTVSAGVVTMAAAITFDGGGGGVTGDVADYLTVFKNTATPASSTLAITWDSASSGLPVTPNGGNITATWGSNIVLTVGV